MPITKLPTPSANYKVVANDTVMRDKINEVVDEVNPMSEMLDKMFPIGTIYESTSPTNPGTFRPGTWELYGQGRVTVGLDTTQTEFNTVGKTGGAKTHTLVRNELPKFKLEANASVRQGGGWSTETGSKYPVTEGNGYILSRTPDLGNDQPHNNLQPFITVYRFRRTA